MGTKYKIYKLDISDNQKEKIKLALKNNEGVTIRIEKNGDDAIALTQSQVDKINKAFQNNKSTNIKLSKTQLQYNKNKIEGGFLGSFLTAALAPVATELVGDLAKKVLGKGLFLSNEDGHVIKVKTHGEGLYIYHSHVPPFKGSNIFYKDHSGKYVNGEGILGSLIKANPLLNLII